MVEINNTFPPIIKENLFTYKNEKRGGGVKYNGHIIGQQAIEK